MTKGKLPRLRVVSGDPGPEAGVDGDEGVQLAAQAGSIQAALRVGQAQSTSQAVLAAYASYRHGGELKNMFRVHFAGRSWRRQSNVRKCRCDTRLHDASELAGGPNLVSAV